MLNKLIISTLILCSSVTVLLLSTSWAKTTPKIVEVARFSEQDLKQWKIKSFSGETQYHIEEKNGAHVLSASADMSASALYKRIKIDLTQTPYLNWSWQVESALKPLQEQSKAGDDYAARVYVIVKLGALPWKTYALNYVWSSNSETKESWPNAFVDNAVMIPKRSSIDPNKTWLTEKVNVRADFKKYLGFDIDEIDGVAVMTDADNSKSFAAANYGDIYFTSN